MPEKRQLEEYLRSLAPDKSKLLVDKGEGTKLDLTPSVREGNNNSLLIIKRTKETAETTDADLSAISANLNAIYPGAIVYADSSLVDGRPNLVVGEGLIRKPVSVGLDIHGNTQEPILVKRPNHTRVMAAVHKMVDQWCESGHSAAARLTYKSAMVCDEKQLHVTLGLKDTSQTFGIDFKANAEGKQKEMLICFNQVYYSARIEPATASGLYDDSVTQEDLADYLNQDNPAAALITSVDFGRMIVVKLSTSEVTEDVEAAWKASISSYGIENKNEYKHIMSKTQFSIFVYGGSTGIAKKFLNADISKVNEIIAEDMEFKKGSAACVLGYSTNYIDDGKQAQVSHALEYVKTTVSMRKNIRFRTDTANAYATKQQKLYGRPIIGINEDGSFRLGAWEKLLDEGNGNQERTLNGKYAEFGFGFDIVWGTDWPYSSVFWTADKAPAEDIFIEWGGTVRNAWIEIKVNGERVFYDADCDSHSEYNFGC